MISIWLKPISWWFSNTQHIDNLSTDLYEFGAKIRGIPQIHGGSYLQKHS